MKTGSSVVAEGRAVSLAATRPPLIIESVNNPLCVLSFGTESE
jgi:hypothetical protein